MKCIVYPLDTLKTYKYVVILTKHENKIVLSRHRSRDTWETQGGHIEAGETPVNAAKRELWEESGAEDYDIFPLCDYWAADEISSANGQVFVANVRRFGKMPDSEMKEIGFFDSLPENLTYPDITPILFSRLTKE
ncbi:MAG: NUDIX domain-containing protein [Clostridia bacterium]|nr:NUDIX domain-containing protein [Clostridia bacterium]